jgi:hypothetical protein
LGPRTWVRGTAADGGINGHKLCVYILDLVVAVKQKTPLHNTCKRDENTQKVEKHTHGTVRPATRVIPEVLTMLP